MRGNASEPGPHLIITSCLGASGSLYSSQGFDRGRAMLLDLQRTVIETLQIVEHGTCSSNALFYSGNAFSYPKLVQRHSTQK